MLKALAICALSVLALIFLTAVAAGAYVLTTGVGTVQIQTPELGGVELYLPVPTALVDLGLTVASSAVPAHERAQIRREMEAWQPVVRRVTQELADCPDGALVHVETPQETVSVFKKRGRLVVDVDAPDAKVRVSIPGRSLDRIGRKLEAFLY